ncbi:hypothetical protein ACP275_07G105100 [Erythranthe tilingii]
MDLKELLFSQVTDAHKTSKQLSVIPIVGVCGSGKTTLARLVYDDREATNQFKVRAWVKVEGHELKLLHAAHGILKSALGISCSIDDVDELDEIVRDTLHYERCLIVFDGIESMSKDSWSHMVKHWFDFVGSGSVVLITTSRSDVANLVGNHTPFELPQLSEYAALSMYRHLAYDSLEKDVTTTFMAKNVAALCGGDSLSLRLFGSCMRYHSKLRELVSSVDFSDVMRLPAPDASAVILMCVWALPRHLRHCFALCSIFPKGYPLNTQKIIRMSIAHLDCYHYFSDIDDSCIDQLISMSFFTDVTYNDCGEVVDFRMPDLIHTTAEDVARIVLELKLGRIYSIGDDAATLSFVGNCESEDVETLILAPTIYLGGVLDCSLAQFLDLHSLDLSCSGIRMLSEDICALEELRYLNLSYTLIEMLPDSITDLSELRTLDLSWCYHLKALPERLRNLTQMRHLDLYRCESLSHLPSGIGYFENLTSMPLLVLGNDSDCACLGDLQRLNKLRGRLEIRNLENARGTSDAKSAELRFKNLDHLGLSWSWSSSSQSMGDEYDWFEVLEELEPNERLKVLDLTGYMGSKFPRWISFMYNLIKISISDCGCEKLPALGQLPRLEELQLKGMRYIKRIGPEIYGDRDGEHDVTFPSLKKLGLYDLPMLFEWSDYDLRHSSLLFPRLETLTVEGCPQLRYMPYYPNTLLHLTVCNSSGGILQSLTRFGVLCSVLIKDMEIDVPLTYLTSLCNVQKLVLFNIKDELTIRLLAEFPNLVHLGILHCHQLRSIRFFISPSLEKLHISDCPNLSLIGVTSYSISSHLKELVVEDCPLVTQVENMSSCLSLRKLIIKGCSEFKIDHGELNDLKKLEYLLISGCPNLERRLRKDTSLISRIPCVILGDRKVSPHV